MSTTRFSPKEAAKKQIYEGRERSLSARPLPLPSDLPFRTHRGMNVWTKGVAGNSMQIESKYLCLRGPVTLGSRFDDWRVCWLGGWAKHRMFYLVMLVRVKI